MRYVAVYIAEVPDSQPSLKFTPYENPVKNSSKPPPESSVQLTKAQVDFSLKTNIEIKLDSQQNTQDNDYSCHFSNKAYINYF